MPSSISRGPVTNHLLTVLKTENFPVGDNSSPTDEHGWQGEPNGEASTFIPWMTLTPGTATPQTPPGAMGDTGTMWKLGYMVFYAGLSRRQTEALADKMRNTFTNLSRVAVETNTGDWRIMKVSCVAVGSSNRIGSAYPDYYTQSDTYEVWITKE